MPTVTLGNVAPVNVTKKDDSVVLTPENSVRDKIDMERSVTQFNIPGPATFQHCLSVVLEGWALHSDSHPVWVESDTPGLAEALTASFNMENPDNKIVTGRPKDWEISEIPADAPKTDLSEKESNGKKQ